VNRWIWLACAAAAFGCGGSLSSGASASSAAPAPRLSQAVQTLRVHVATDVAIVTEGNTDARLGQSLKTAVEAELVRRGLKVVPGTDKPADLTLRIETRVKGAVFFLRGHVGLTAEKSGTVVASAATPDEIHGDAEFTTVMAAKAVTTLLGSSALGEFAEKRVGRPEPARPRPVARPAVLVAKTPTPEAEAKARYARGTSYYNLGRFREALAEYEAAYLAVQDPPFLFNIAQCNRKMGRDQEALGAYRSYLRVAPTAPNRLEVQKRIGELERETRAAALTPTPNGR
jgi:hypothetical protein